MVARGGHGIGWHLVCGARVYEFCSATKEDFAKIYLPSENLVLRESSVFPRLPAFPLIVVIWSAHTLCVFREIKNYILHPVPATPWFSVSHCTHHHPPLISFQLHNVGRPKKNIGTCCTCQAACARPRCRYKINTHLGVHPGIGHCQKAHTSQHLQPFSFSQILLRVEPERGQDLQI